MSQNLLSKKGTIQHPVEIRQHEVNKTPLPIFRLVTVSEVLLHYLHVAICGVLAHNVGYISLIIFP